MPAPANAAYQRCEIANPGWSLIPEFPHADISIRLAGIRGTGPDKFESVVQRIELEHLFRATSHLRPGLQQLMPMLGAARLD